MNRQRLILFVLVIVFAVAVIWSYSAMPRLKTAGPASAKPVQSARPASVPTKTPVRTADDGSRLKIDLLDKDASGFSGYRRNIFKPAFVDETKITKQTAVAIKPPPPKPVAAPVEQVLIQPEAAPLARFTFLGFLKKGAVKTIFLAKEKDILLVKKGDKLAGRYEATDISDQALTLTVTDTGDEIVIPLIENRPLASGK
ncbi:MAG: hypothetical protein A2076_17740 [Geobacteraceae bacterium GWC2_53_11]|nr:MAG: hypothetical protein A2076_17740 [Geobacteraceae bacterium GWC2_53_11]